MVRAVLRNVVQQSPADVLAMLSGTPDEVSRVLEGPHRPATRPAPDDWPIAELIEHLIESDAVFRSSVTTVLDSNDVPALASCRPWTRHEGKSN
jgi:hypothetical protein